MSTLLVVWRLPDVRRLQLAWGFAVVAGSSSLIAFLVYAFAAGGSGLVATYGVLRVLPGAVVTPLVTGLGDRVPRDHLLRWTTAARAVLVTIAAIGAFVSAPPWIVIAAGAASASMSSTFRPLQASTLPWLVRTPGELTSANVTATMMENGGSLLGPLVAGAMLVVAGPAAVLTFSALCMAGALLALLRLQVPRQAAADGAGARTMVRDAVAGADALRRIAPPGGLVVVAFAQTFARGALLVVSVVLVLGPLQLGDDAVAWLNAAMGIGGLVAGAWAAAVLRATRLGRSFLLGVALWGLPLVALAASPTVVAAYATFLVIGVGNTLEDAGAMSLLPRVVDHRLVGRAIGALELVIILGLATGSLCAPLLEAWLGLQGTLAAIGLVVLAAVVAYVRPFTRIDRSMPEPPAELTLLRELPMFSVLPMVVVDQLAAEIEHHAYETADVVMREGEAGDRFHVIVSGTARVTVAGTPRATLHRGEGMGEIALLRGVPRTATVTAAEPLRTVSLARDPFLDAVTGNQLSAESAHALADRRLAGDPT